MNVFVIIAVVIVFAVVVASVVVAIYERVIYNRGICRHCGSRFKPVIVGLFNQTYFRCSKCGDGVWLSLYIPKNKKQKGV